MSEAPQETEQWHADRAGLVTASRVHRILTRNLDSWRTLAAELEAEAAWRRARDRGEPVELTEIETPATAWGKRHEPHARELFALIYAARYGEPVTRGLVRHPTVKGMGGSPDFTTDMLVGEIKCPFNSSVHRATLAYGMPQEHAPQIQMNMMCCGRDLGMFISYDPRQMPNLQLYTQLVKRDAAMQSKIMTVCLEFLEWYSGRGEAPEKWTGDQPIPQIF